MKKIIFASVFLIVACKEERKEGTSKSIPVIKENIVSETKPNESEEAKKWLETKC